MDDTEGHYKVKNQLELETLGIKSESESKAVEAHSRKFRTTENFEKADGQGQKAQLPFPKVEEYLRKPC